MSDLTPLLARTIMADRTREAAEHRRLPRGQRSRPVAALLARLRALAPIRPQVVWDPASFWNGPQVPVQRPRPDTRRRGLDAVAPPSNHLVAG